MDIILERVRILLDDLVTRFDIPRSTIVRRIKKMIEVGLLFVDSWGACFDMVSVILAGIEHGHSFNEPG